MILTTKHSSYQETISVENKLFRFLLSTAYILFMGSIFFSSLNCTNTSQDIAQQETIKNTVSDWQDLLLPV